MPVRAHTPCAMRARALYNVATSLDLSHIRCSNIHAPHDSSWGKPPVVGNIKQPELTLTKPGETAPKTTDTKQTVKGNFKSAEAKVKDALEEQKTAQVSAKKTAEAKNKVQASEAKTATPPTSAVEKDKEKDKDKATVKDKGTEKPVPIQSKDKDDDRKPQQTQEPEKRQPDQVTDTASTGAKVEKAEGAPVEAAEKPTTDSNRAEKQQEEHNNDQQEVLLLFFICICLLLLFRAFCFCFFFPFFCSRFHCYTRVCGALRGLLTEVVTDSLEMLAAVRLALHCSRGK